MVVHSGSVTVVLVHVVMIGENLLKILLFHLNVILEMTKITSFMGLFYSVYKKLIRLNGMINLILKSTSID